MLHFLDIIFTILHLAIIVFNLFGWIPKATRRANFISILLTAGSWFILGLFFGLGYCPLTDWQWQVKARLGETGLPGNFVEYFAKKITGIDFPSQLIDYTIAITFFIAATLSFYVNFFDPETPVRNKS